MSLKGKCSCRRTPRIVRAIGWTWDAAWIIEQLVALEYLARDEAHRLIVCDWPEQCEPSCHQAVADQGIAFADGTASTRRPRQNSREGRRRRAEQQVREASLEQFSPAATEASAPNQPKQSADAPSRPKETRDPYPQDSDPRSHAPPIERYDHYLERLAREAIGS